MRRAVCLIALTWLLVLLPVSAVAYELLILQSSSSPVYDQVLKGLRSTQQFSERLLVVSQYAEVDLQRIIREERPLAILALGDTALALAATVRRVPVVALMAADLRSYSQHENITGVDVLAAPERFFQAFQQLRARRVGLVGSPTKSGAYMRRMQHTAQRYGLELVLREVRSGREVQAQLQGLQGRVDALWLLPDTTALTRDTVDLFFRFSLEQRVPVVAFANAYLAAGAAVALEVDRRDIGVQGALLLQQVMRGEAPGEVAVVSTRRAVIRMNQAVLGNLGLSP